MVKRKPKIKECTCGNDSFKIEVADLMMKVKCKKCGKIYLQLGVTHEKRGKPRSEMTVIKLKLRSDSL